MADCGSQKQLVDGSTELGLDTNEIEQFMAANRERAEDKRHKIDRPLMNGEWPFLLKVM